MSRRLHCFVLSLLLAGSALAQDVPERAIFDIELREDARLSGGKSAFLEGQTNAYGQQFQVLETQLQQPIAVGLYTRNPDQPLQLRIAKGTLDEPVRELRTDAQGRIDLKFRTHDGFKLWVTSDQPADYQLVVWVGDAIAVQPPRAVIPASDYAAEAAAAAAGIDPGVDAANDRSASPSTATQAIGRLGLSRLEMGLGLGLLLALVVVAFAFIQRRRPAGGTP